MIYIEQDLNFPITASAGQLAGSLQWSYLVTIPMKAKDRDAVVQYLTG